MDFKTFRSMFRTGSQTRKSKRFFSSPSLSAGLEVLETRILLSATSNHQSDGHIENEIEVEHGVEVEHGIEVENEVEHGVEVEHQMELETEIEHGVQFLVPHNRNDNNSSRSTVAQWSEVAGATSYNLEVYDVTRGQKVKGIPAVSGTDFDLTETLASLEEFQVFVQPNNGDLNLEHWQQVTSFSSSPTLETAISSDPASAGLSQLDWSVSIDASNYELQIYDTRRGRLVLSDDGIPSTSFSLPQTLEAHNTYQAFVRSVNEFGERHEWSTPVEFEFQPVEMTDPTKSNDNSNNDSIAKWSVDDNAISYELEIYDVDRGQRIESISTIVETSYDLSETRLSHPNIQAFVRSIDNTGDTSHWSEVKSFEASNSTGANGTELSEDHPVISNLATSTKNSQLTVSWTNSISGSTAEVQVYNKNLGRLVGSAGDLIVSRFELEKSLESGFDYQVFVRETTDSGEKSEWSDPVEFHFERLENELLDTVFSGLQTPTHI